FVSQKTVSLVGRWRHTQQIGVNPSQQRPRVCFRRARNPGSCEFSVNEPVDRVANAREILYRRRNWLLWWLKRPIIIAFRPTCARIDPFPDPFDFFRRQSCPFLWHLIIRVAGSDPSHELTLRARSGLQGRLPRFPAG